MRSTKQRGIKEARKVADSWEDAARHARAGELTQVAAIKMLSELMEQTSGESLTIESIEQFLLTWLGSRETVGRSGSTAKRYRPIINGFIAFLGPQRTRGSVGSVTVAEIERFRDKQLAEGKGGTTANFAVKVLRAVLNAARRKGLALSNPAEAVELLEAHAEEREAFTDEDIGFLLTAAGDSDWRGMIILGVHCGLRINDAANLTWDALDLDRGAISFSPAKTSRKTGNKAITVALHSDAIQHFEARVRGIAKAPLFPALYGKKTGSAGGLSNAFAALMEKAKVRGLLGAEKKGKGRQFRSKGFHSLRHTFISRLANADVAGDVRKAMAGHSSDAVHRKYTHLNLETQQRAVGKLASVL